MVLNQSTTIYNDLSKLIENCTQLYTATESKQIQLIGILCQQLTQFNAVTELADVSTDLSSLHATYNKLITICITLYNYTTGIPTVQYKQLIHQCKQLYNNLNNNKSFQFQYGYQCLLRYIILPVIIQLFKLHTDQFQLITLLYSLIQLIYNNHHSCLLNELNLFYNHIVIPLLQSNNSSLQQVTANHLSHTIFNTNYHINHSTLLYYNYDVLRLGRLDACHTLQLLIKSICTALHSSSTCIPYTGLHISGSTDNDTQPQNKLSTTATVLFDLAAAGLTNTTNNMLNNSTVKYNDQQSHSLVIDSTLQLLLQYATLLNIQSIPTGHNELYNTKVSKLVQQYSQYDKVVSDAITLFNQSGCKSMLKYFIKLDSLDSNDTSIHPMKYSTMSYIAHFCYTYNKQLEPSEIGDLLSCSDDTLYSSTDYHLLRYRYLQNYSYSNMTLVCALRLFLTHTGFRLPGEAQKIDRLLDIFCTRYMECNKSSVSFTHSTAFILSFAIVMLNTDLHDTRLKSNNKNDSTSHSSRVPMSCDQFIRNLRGVSSDGVELDRLYLVNIYNEIKADQIQWKQPYTTANENNVDNHTAEVNNCIFTYLSQHSLHAIQWYLIQSPYKDYSTELYHSIHSSLYTALYNTTNSNTNYTQLCTCIDTIQQLCIYTVSHELPQYTRQYTILLHQLIQSNEPLNDTIDQQSLMQLNSINHSSLHILQTICASIKQYVVQCESMNELHVLQSQFNTELNLSTLHNNQMVKSDVVDRISIDKSNSTVRTGQLYLFLCNNVLLIAHSGINTVYKLLMSSVLYNVRVIDIQHTTIQLPKHCIVLYTTHKQYMISYDTAASKSNWLQLLSRCITQSIRYKHNAGVTDSTTNTTCQLCYRLYSLFHRKVQCSLCTKYICNQCRTQRILNNKSITMKSPNNDTFTIKSCDTCYGTHKGIINDHTSVITVQKHNKLSCDAGCDICELK